MIITQSTFQLSSVVTELDVEKKIQQALAQVDQDRVLWFYDHVPTASNLPASEWTTTSLKAEHEFDIFYNRASVSQGGGRAYMWILDSGAYAWHEITDADSIAALSAAANAQDTADAKRRVFVSQPLDAAVYDVGDLWVNATYTNPSGVKVYDNDTLVCNVSKKVGRPFSIDHWAPASNSTTSYIQSSITSTRNEILLAVGKDVDSVRSLASIASDWASTAYTRANEAYNWADLAWNSGIEANKKADAVDKKADAAAAAASTAQSRADAAYGLGTTAQAAVQVLDGKVTAVAGRFTSDGKLADTSYLVLETDFAAFQTSHFNADGSLKNTAGLVISSGTGNSSFANLFASYVTFQGVAKTAAITAYVDNRISAITITADKIDLTGYTTINSSFTISSSGTMSTKNAVMAFAVINDSNFSGTTLFKGPVIFEGTIASSGGAYFMLLSPNAGDILINGLGNSVNLGVTELHYYNSSGNVYFGIDASGYANLRGSWRRSSSGLLSGAVYADSSGYLRIV